MNGRKSCLISIVAASCVPATTLHAQSVSVWTDPEADAVVRRTDIDNDGVIGAAGGCAEPNLPDIIEISTRGWVPTDPTDRLVGRYQGVAGNHANGANFARIDVTFKGLVNPPGPLDFPLNPFQYGPNAAIGYISFDIDENPDTGGIRGPSAADRYLANVARFGGMPQGILKDRAAPNGQVFDIDFFTGPYYERTGADFILALCGCGTTAIIDESTTGTPNEIFEPGETWIVNGEYFRRAFGYADFGCFVDDIFNVGYYNPPVDLRFEHRTADDTTLVTLIYPLDQDGWAEMTGNPVEPVDCDPANSFSIEEAVSDLLASAAGDYGPISPNSVRTLTERWDLVPSPLHVLEPSSWDLAGFLIGTSYCGTDVDGFIHVWTDTNVVQGDINGDGVADQADHTLVDDYIIANDGGFIDIDGDPSNNEVQIMDFGTNFDVHDVDGDGFVGASDLDFFDICIADWDTNGVINAFDLIGFLTIWFAVDSGSDLNNDLVIDIFDVLEYLNFYYAGC